MYLNRFLDVIGSDRLIGVPLADNILATAADATPSEIAEGLGWYASANQLAKDIANEHELTTEQTAAIIARVSPQVRWSANIEYAWDIAAAAKENRLPNCPQAYGQNIKLALDVALGRKSPGSVFNPATGPKITAFFRNIAFLCKETITVDSWAIRAAIDCVKTPALQVTPKQYALIADAYLSAADSTRYLGYELQAIVWLTARRLAAS